MKDFHKLIIAVIGCELVGILSTPFTIAAIPTWYAYLNKPFFSPPNWIFAPVWTILYFLMGVSAYLIWKNNQKNKKKNKAFSYFYLQLFLNFTWSFFFFGLQSPFLGFINIIVLLVSIILTVNAFYKISKLSAYLLIPYLLWVSFASVLNFSIYLLNW